MPDLENPGLFKMSYYSPFGPARATNAIQDALESGDYSGIAGFDPIVTLQKGTQDGYVIDPFYNNDPTGQAYQELENLILRLENINLDPENMAGKAAAEASYNPATALNDIDQFIQNLPMYQEGLESGIRSISRSNAARGLLGSGNAALELRDYGQNLGTQVYAQHLQNLMNQYQIGQTSALAQQNAEKELGQFVTNTQADYAKTLLSGRIQGLQDVINAATRAEDTEYDDKKSEAANRTAVLQSLIAAAGQSGPAGLLGLGALL